MPGEACKTLRIPQPQHALLVPPRSPDMQGCQGCSPQNSLHTNMPADLWARFVRYQEDIDNVAAKLVLVRATALFCKQRPEMHIFAGQFQELHGDVLAARASFTLVTGSLAPTLIEGESRQACDANTLLRIMWA